MSPDLEGASCQSEAARLLPWYLVGRLAPADTERVAQHLDQCAICRSDLTHETALRARLTAADPIEYAPQAGLAKTLARIDELGRDESIQSPPVRTAALRPRRSATIRWLTAAVLIEGLGLGWWGLSATQHSPNRKVERYETLSSDPSIPVGTHIRVVFAPDMTVADLRALLAANHLRVVSGPSESGTFTLMATEGPTDATGATVAALRRDARVLFAEPAVNDARVTP